MSKQPPLHNHVDPRLVPEEVEFLAERNLSPDEYCVLVMSSPAVQVQRFTQQGTTGTILTMQIALPDDYIRIPTSTLLDANNQPMPTRETLKAVPQYPPLCRILLARSTLGKQARAQLREIEGVVTGVERPTFNTDRPAIGLFVPPIESEPS